MYPKILKNVVDSFENFPGVGEKTAERMAFSVLSMEDEQVRILSENLVALKKNIKYCSICNGLSENKICNICSDNMRDKNLLCLVEDPKTIFSIEKLGSYNGYYFVLNGLISSYNGVNPDELRLNKLVDLINEHHYSEIIIAFKQCIEGEMTALYIKNILSDMNIKVSRIASGIPIGADMEYVDSLTLEKAFDNRQIIS